MLTTGPQLRAARAMAGLQQGELAERAGVGATTVKRLEAMDGELSANRATRRVLQQALEAAGVVFTARGVELRDEGGDR